MFATNGLFYLTNHYLFLYGGDNDWGVSNMNKYSNQI